LRLRNSVRPNFEPRSHEGEEDRVHLVAPFGEMRRTGDEEIALVHDAGPGKLDPVDRIGDLSTEAPCAASASSDALVVRFDRAIDRGLAVRAM